MSFCFIEAASVFQFLALPGLFVGIIKEDEAGERAGGLQRGAWVKNEGCTMAMENPGWRKGSGGAQSRKKKFWPA